MDQDRLFRIGDLRFADFQRGFLFLQEGLARAVPSHELIVDLTEGDRRADGGDDGLLPWLEHGVLDRRDLGANLVVGDEQLLVRAFHALLETAVKFSKNGETVRLSQESVEDSVKVIIESSALTREEIVKVSALAKEAGAHFVKTSTGFNASGGASLEARSFADIIKNSI